MSTTATMAAALAKHQAGNLGEARDLYCRVLEQDPNHPEALHLLGVVAHQAGRSDLALTLMNRSRPHQIANAFFENNLGAVFQAGGDLENAALAFERALKINPGYSEAWCNLADVLQKVGRIEEAITALKKALHHTPEAETAAQLGKLLEDWKRWGEAEESYEIAKELAPERADIWNNLGNVLAKQERHEEAIAAFRATLERDPHHTTAYNNLAGTLLVRGRLSQAIQAYREAIRADPTNAATHSNLLFALVYDPNSTSQEIFEEHVRWGTIHAPSRVRADHDNPRIHDRRLRVGYVSPDFRQHPVARFVEPILANHDSNRFEIYAYADVEVPDSVTGRLRSLCSQWREIRGKRTDEVVARMRGDQIDILVDLTGHTANHRLEVFAHKPAPIQVTYLGYPGTSGMSAMDYRLTESIADPLGAEKFATEELIRLGPAFCCFAIPEEAPPVGPLPARKRGYVTFGSPHNLAKLNAHVFDLWSKILDNIPNSRLLLFRGGLRGSIAREIREEFQRRGVEGDRIEVSELSTAMVGYAGYLRAYHDVDLILDAFPANAGTTACEALIMGVPLITLLGERFYARLSGSLLTSVGLTEAVTRTPDEYLGRAITWATDLNALEEIRHTLRPRLLASPLCDAANFTGNLERAYRAMWHRYCGHSPSCGQGIL